MKRMLAMLVALLVAGTAWADIPPPKGLKRITVDHKIETAKEYPEYAFFTVIGGRNVTAVKLDPKNPVVIAGAGRGGVGRLCLFVAVPKDAAKKYGTEKEFHEAIAGGKVEGLLRASADFSPFNDVKDSDPRKVIVTTHTLEKIDAKDGIVFAGKKPGAKDAPPEESDELESDTDLSASNPKGGAWVAGLAGAFAFILGGFWIAGRFRR